MEGSSFYRQPKVLQWFSGNIGYHHIHHLRPRFPNHNLEPCYEAGPEVQEVAPLTLRKSLGCLRLALWDEARGGWLGSGRARRRYSGATDQPAALSSKSAANEVLPDTSAVT